MAKAVTSYPTSSDGQGYGMSRGIDETTSFVSYSAPSTGATPGGPQQQPYSDARSGTGGYDAATRLSSLPGRGGQDPGGQAYDLSKGKDVGQGTTRFNGGSSPLFTNVPDAADNASLMGRGTVSARNDNAAQVLSDRTQHESSPSDVRLATEGKSAIYQADQKLVKRRAEMMRHYSMSKVTGEEEAAGEAKEAIQGFNEVNPDPRINALQMAASVRTRRKQIEESEQGVYLPQKRRDAMEAGRFALSE